MNAEEATRTRELFSTFRQEHLFDANSTVTSSAPSPPLPSPIPRREEASVSVGTPYGQAEGERARRSPCPWHLLQHTLSLPPMIACTVLPDRWKGKQLLVSAPKTGRLPEAMIDKSFRATVEVRKGVCLQSEGPSI
jgi:hypothetical protein